MDRTRQPLNRFFKIDTFLISTRRALSRQHKIGGGKFIRTSPKSTICAETKNSAKFDGAEAIKYVKWERAGKPTYF